MRRSHVYGQHGKGRKKMGEKQHSLSRRTSCDDANEFGAEVQGGKKQTDCNKETTKENVTWADKLFVRDENTCKYESKRWETRS
jgi:hypothetical protein